jgi:hypothetical protein
MCVYAFSIWKDREYLDACIQIIEHCLPRLRFKSPSFLCGDAGVLAIGAAAYAKSGDKTKSLGCYKTLVDKCSPSVLDLSSGVPDELLYGRAGFLYSLLFVQREAPPDVVTVDEDLIRAVCKAIVLSGVKVGVDWTVISNVNDVNMQQTRKKVDQAR